MYMLYIGEGAHIVLGGGPCVAYHDVYGGPHVVWAITVVFFVWGTIGCIRGHRYPLDEATPPPLLPLHTPQLIDFIS